MIIDLSVLTDGFSSKLRVISFYLAVIKIKKYKKKIYIYEKKTKDSPYLFTDLCLIKDFKIIKLKKKPNNEIKFTPYNYDTELEKLKKKNSINFNDKKFYSISDKLYKNFIPIKKIQKKIKKLNLPKNFIGIHIRSTDREIKIINFLFNIQFKEMIFDFQIKHMIENLLSFVKSKTKIKIFFITSDNKYYKDKIYNKLKKKVKIYSNNSKYEVKSFRQTSGEDFLIELFCLSKSKIIISTLGGAVPKTASMISKNKINIYKWTNVLNFNIIFKYLILIIFNLKKIKSNLLNHLLNRR